MPFVSDEQRKAAFANMRRGGNYGGQGGNKPKTPKTPKRKQTPKTQGNPAYGLGAVGYAGNYTQGAPSWSNWYNNLPNTTAAPPALAPSGSNMGGYGSIPQGSFDLVWDDYQGTGPRELTKAEKIGIGIPAAIALAYAAPGIFALAEVGTELAITAEIGTGLQVGITGLIGVAGTQGGALGYSALAFSGIPMSINDSPNYIRDGNRVHTQYVDLVSWIGGQVRNQKNIDYTISAEGIDWTVK
jgi:hypothetical protein